MANLGSYFTASAYFGLSPAYNQTFNLNGGLSLFFITLVLSIVTIIGMWKMFEKAGKPGWASIVPVYNIVVMLEIIKKPTWMVLLFFIPFVNFIVGLIIVFDIAREFGKGILFAIGMILFPFIFYPILGFGKSTYANAPAAI